MSQKCHQKNKCHTTLHHKNYFHLVLDTSARIFMVHTRSKQVNRNILLYVRHKSLHKLIVTRRIKNNYEMQPQQNQASVNDAYMNEERHSETIHATGNYLRQNTE